MISKKKVRLYPFVIMFCIYIILASLVSILIPNTYIRILIEWIGLLGIVLCENGSLKIYYSDKFFVLFFLLVLFSLIMVTSNSLFDLAIMMPYLLIYFLCRKELTWIVIAYKILIFTNTVYALLTIFFYFNAGMYSMIALRLFPSSYSRLIGWYNDGCMPGLTSHYTINGLLMATGVLLTFCEILENWHIYSKNKKIFKILHLTIFVVSLLLTGKRGPVVFMGASIFVIYYLHLSNRPKGRFVKVMGSLILIICLFAIVFSLFPSLSTFLNRFISLSESGDVTLGREKYWQLAIQYFSENPIFGIGWGRFEILSAETFSNAVDTHNNYLQLLCETGIIGFLIFLGMALFNLHKSIKVYKIYVNNKFYNSNYTYLLAFAVGFQIFFLLYGFSGNPLYTTITYMPYFICYVLVDILQRNPFYISEEIK